MASLRTLHPALIPYAQQFVRALERAGIRVTVTSARRDPKKQAQLYEAYLAGRSKFPAAPPGHSPHELGIAFDVHLDPPAYEAAGTVWESLGLRWGGRFQDRIHFDFYPRGWSPPPRAVPARERAAKSRLPW